MVKALGQITNFFRPYCTPKNLVAEIQYDGDNITVARRKPVVESAQFVVSDRQKSQDLSVQSPQHIVLHREVVSTDDSSPDQPAASPRLSTHVITASTHGPATNDKVSKPQPSEDPVGHPPSSSLLNTSFSSSSSRRKLINGNTAIIDSESDSDGGLEDFSNMYARKRVRLTPEPAQRSRTLARLKPIKAATKPKHTLTDLARQVAKSDAQIERIKQAEADLQELAKSHEQHNATVDVLGSDSDQDRVKAAIDRVGALEQSNVFYFFGSASMLKQHIPTQQLSGHDLQVSLDRIQLNIASDDDMIGIHRAIHVESTNHQTEDYTRLLEAATPTSLPEHILEGFLLRKTYLETCWTASQSTEEIPAGLTACLCSLKILAKHFSSSQRSVTIADLVLLNLDNNIRSSFDTQITIEETLSACLEASSFDARHAAIKQVLSLNQLSKTQICHSIAWLPATTSRLHMFRRYLALQFLFDPACSKPLDKNDIALGRRLFEWIQQTPMLLAKQDTDWNLFCCTLQVLDIAIDAGFSDFNFLHDQTDKRQQAERAFNQDIDMMVQRLRRIASSIQESGATNLRRMEAKSALDILIMRIELTVRTKEKPRTGAFGGKIGAGQQSLKHLLTSNAPTKKGTEYTSSAQ